MRSAILRLLVGGVFAALVTACGDAGGSDEPEDRAPAGFSDFREFSREIEEALEEEDSQFFLDRGRLLEAPCAGNETTGPCADGSGTFQGLGVDVTGTQFDFVVPLAEYSDGLRLYIEGSVASISDSIGGGAMQLHALATAPSGSARPAFLPAGEDAHYAITSGIINRGSDNMREVRALVFVPGGDGWEFLGEVQVPGGADGAERHAAWVNGSCADCYDYFESWEGASP